MSSLRNRGQRARAIAVAGVAAAVSLMSAGSALAATANDSTQFAVTAGALAFGTAPDAPSLPGLTLNGQSQTLNAQMANFSVVDATGSASGWNVTVQGESGVNKSAVFKQYTTATNTYVATSPATLAANSLTLNSTSASFTAQNGTTGTAPTHQCSSACNVDSASAVKVVSAAANAGMGTYQASSYSSTSLALAAPTTVKALPSGDVYRVDLLWTLGSGP